MYKYLLLFAACIISTFATQAKHTNVVPDSMITEDGVYYYLFSAPENSDYIMSKLRERGCDIKGKEISPMDLDFLEGDMYYNTGRYILSIHYYKKALETAEKEKDSENTFALMHRLVSSYSCTYNETCKMKVLNDMQIKATKENNVPMLSISLFELGNSLCMQRNFNNGLPKMLQGITMMESCNYKHKYDNLRYQYTQIVQQYRKANKMKEALAMCEKLRKIIGKLDPGASPMEHEAETQELALLSQLSSIYLSLGNKDKADKTYQRYKELHNIVPRETNFYNYLIDTQRYNELIPLASKAEKKLKEHGDTISYKFASILKALSTAQLYTGNTRDAAIGFRRLSIIRDSLNSREMEGQAAEYDTIYDVRQIEQDAKRSRLVGITSSIIAALSLLAVVLMVMAYLRIKRFHKAMKQKNIALARTIQQLSKAHENTQIALTKLQQAQPAQETFNDCPDTSSNDNLDINNTNGQEDDERQMFIRLENEIVSRRLYAVNLNRDQLIKELGIPRTLFATLFRDYAGVSYSKYMNQLRLREAVRLMRENPDYTIEAIVSKCGMSRQLFYMLFREEYGITPTEFRAAQKK